MNDPIVMSIIGLVGLLVLACIIGMARNWNRRSKDPKEARLQRQYGGPLLRPTVAGWLLILLTVSAVVIPALFILAPAAAQAGLPKAMAKLGVMGCGLLGLMTFGAGYGLFCLLGIRVWSTVHEPEREAELNKPPRKVRWRLGEDQPTK